MFLKLSFRLTKVTLYSAIEVTVLFTALYKLTILQYIVLQIQVTKPAIMSKTVTDLRAR